MKELIHALQALSSKLTWPHFLVVAVVVLFAAGFKHVTSWQDVAYLLCLGLGVILLGGLCRRMHRARKRNRRYKQPSGA